MRTERFLPLLHLPAPDVFRVCDHPRPAAPAFARHAQRAQQPQPYAREPLGVIPLREHASHHGTTFTLQNVGKAGTQALPAVVIQEPEEPYDLGDFTVYSTSDKVKRYFCSSCSARLLVARTGEDGKETWSVAAGVLAGVAGVMKRAYHQWVGATLDGGIADFLRTVNGLELPRYGESVGSQVLPLPWHANAEPKNDAPASDHRLRGRCRCGGVQFAITRPTTASAKPRVEYPDLFVRHDGARLTEISNMHDEKWWLFPHDRQPPPPAIRYLAGHCMCSMCRFASGAELVSWAYVPAVNIVHLDTGNPLNLTEEGGRPKALRQYIVNPGEFWEFCGVCGATVFSWRFVHEDLIQVAVGVFDEEKGGLRQEGWLEWHKKRIGYQEKALDPALAESLVDGCEAQ